MNAEGRLALARELLAVQEQVASEHRSACGFIGSLPSDVPRALCQAAWRWAEDALRRAHACSEACMEQLDLMDVAS